MARIPGGAPRFLPDPLFSSPFNYLKSCYIFFIANSANRLSTGRNFLFSTVQAAGGSHDELHSFLCTAAQKTVQFVRGENMPI
jgi:hypothetical protein